MVFSGLKERLSKTHNALFGGVESAFGGTSREESLELIEEALLAADIGVETTLELVDGLTSLKKFNEENVRGYLKDSIFEILKGAEASLTIPDDIKPYVIMVLGVNGVGKTTTIGKLASYFIDRRKSVLLGAGDTFRAAAIEQLDLWATRAKCDIVKHKDGGDPGAVAFDAIKSAKAKEREVVIIDTAGRLHTKANLMEELKKIQRVAERGMEGAPHEKLLILDASTGQNAINQARLFDEAVGVTGLIITKLDGTAKGGIIVPIAKELNIPIRFIGVGEGVRDLREFYARDFADALI